jgi:hypothetical protein
MFDPVKLEFVSSRTMPGHAAKLPCPDVGLILKRHVFPAAHATSLSLVTTGRTNNEGADFRQPSATGLQSPIPETTLEGFEDRVRLAGLVRPALWSAAPPALQAKQGASTFRIESRVEISEGADMQGQENGRRAVCGRMTADKS